MNPSLELLLNVSDKVKAVVSSAFGLFRTSPEPLMTTLRAVSILLRFDQSSHCRCCCFLPTIWNLQSSNLCCFRQMIWSPRLLGRRRRCFRPFENKITALFFQLLWLLLPNNFVTQNEILPNDGVINQLDRKKINLSVISWIAEKSKKCMKIENTNCFRNKSMGLVDAI